MLKIMQLTLNGTETANEHKANHRLTWLYCLLGIFGLRQRAIRADDESNELHFDDSAGKSQKYQTSSLTGKGAARLWDRLQEAMVETRPFLENGLKISDLAALLDVSVHHLSETINSHAKVSFYEFINDFRVEEGSRMLVDPDLVHLSVTDIVYLAGFNSNSTFFDHFKKRKKQTPNQYRKSNMVAENPK